MQLPTLPATEHGHIPANIYHGLKTLTQHLLWLKPSTAHRRADRHKNPVPTSGALFRDHEFLALVPAPHQACELQTSNVFSQAAMRTDDLAAPNRSGGKLELSEAVDKRLGQLVFPCR